MYIYIYIYIHVCVYIYIYIYTHLTNLNLTNLNLTKLNLTKLYCLTNSSTSSSRRSISEISSCFFLGRDPGTLKSDIVSKKTSTINLFGFETLKLTIRRLKLWEPTVVK